MFRQSVKTSLALLAVFALFSLGAVSTVHIYADSKRECGDMKWTDKGHDDNNPSSKKFDKAAYSQSLCQIAKGVDHAVLDDHKSVNWDKFQNSPAFTQASDDQQKCLTKAHKDGNGMSGLGGYEILYCAIDKT